MDQFYQISTDSAKSLASARDAVPAAYKISDKLSQKAESFESSSGVNIDVAGIFSEIDIRDLASKTYRYGEVLVKNIFNDLFSDYYASPQVKKINQKEKQKRIAAHIKAYEQKVERYYKILMEARAESAHSKAVTEQIRNMYGTSLAASQPDSQEKNESYNELEYAYVKNSEDTIATA